MFRQKPFIILYPFLGNSTNHTTVKLGDRERFDKQHVCVKEPFQQPIVNLLHKDKEHLALRNNFMVTKKFLIAKFDCTYIYINLPKNHAGK